MNETLIHKPLSTLIALLSALLMVALAVPATAGPPATAAASSPAAENLERFKNLAGEWRGTNDHGQTVHLSYELVGDGTAVLERIRIEGDAEHDMATLYHLDGDALMLTHYCAAGNQPRMRAAAVSPSAPEILFELVDVTNLAGAGAGHMRRARFEFPDEDRMKSAWTWHEHGKDAFTVAVDAKRVSAGRLASR